MKVTPHVAQNKASRASALPDEIEAGETCATSQQERKRIEKGFGWGKCIGTIRQAMLNLEYDFSVPMASALVRWLWESCGALALLGLAWRHRHRV